MFFIIIIVCYTILKSKLFLILLQIYILFLKGLSTLHYAQIKFCFNQGVEL